MRKGEFCLSAKFEKTDGARAPYIVNSPGHLAEFNRGMNPEGISSSSPELASFSQPWEIKKSIRNPESVVSVFGSCLNGR